MAGSTGGERQESLGEAGAGVGEGDRAEGAGVVGHLQSCPPAQEAICLALREPLEPATSTPPRFVVAAAISGKSLRVDVNLLSLWGLVRQQSSSRAMVFCLSLFVSRGATK